MESISVKKNRFSLKNKTGVGKFSSTAKQIDSKDGSEKTVSDVQITEREPNTTDKLKKCYLPQVKTSNLFSDWKPLPKIEDMMEAPAKCDKENKLNPPNTKSNSNVWMPLPQPCLKCIAQHFLGVRLIVQEVGMLKERGAEVINQSGIQLTSELQELRIQNRTTSPGYLGEKKARLDASNSSFDMALNNPSGNIELGRCPVCATVLHPSTQAKKDAHIALCLSAADTLW